MIIMIILLNKMKKGRQQVIFLKLFVKLIFASLQFEFFFTI